MELLNHAYMGYFVYVCMVGAMWLGSQCVGD